MTDRRDTAAKREAEARSQRRRRRLIGYGQWNPWHDVEPVRVYVQELMAAGLSLPAISARTGVKIGVFQALLYGNKRRALSEKIRTEHAEAILAFRPTLDDWPDDASVDATGSKRRLQALAVRGFPTTRVAAFIGTHERNFHRVMRRASKTTSAATARLIRDAYDNLWDRDPAELGIPEPFARRTRDAAERQGWDGPLAWDDETIDDPKAKPCRGRRQDTGIDMAKVLRAFDGTPLDLTGQERTAAIEYGARTLDMPFERIAEHLGMEYEAVKQSWERIKARARKRGEKWPDAPKWADPLYTTPAKTAA